MKLLRIGARGAEKPAIVDAEGGYRDLSGLIPDLDETTLDPATLDKLRACDPASLPLVPQTERIGACVARPPNFHCVGLNYTAHAAEGGWDVPTEPVLFAKATSCISGAYDAIPLPLGSQKTDWEVELGVVIGTQAHNVSEARALDHVAGYCIANDVSERAFQMDHGGLWGKGKSAPGFGPLGPWLVTADEVPDPQALDLSLQVNGETVQSSRTDDMIFSVAEIVSYMSRFMQLLPGDVIATGTPPGVGMGLKPQRFLKPGDVVEARIERLGQQRQRVEAHS